MIVSQDYIIYDLPLQEWRRETGWAIKSIDDVASVVGGGTPDTEVPEYWSPGDVAWATPTDISATKGVYLSRTERRVSQSGAVASGAALIPANSVLLTSRATIGECRINTIPVITNQGFASLVPRAGTDSRFLFYLARFLKPTLVRLASGSTYVEVSRREVRRIRFGCPGSDEQAAIAEVLHRIDAALVFGPTEQLIRLRRTLLQNLLTGQVRVAAAAA